PYPNGLRTRSSSASRDSRLIVANDPTSRSVHLGMFGTHTPSPHVTSPSPVADSTVTDTLMRHDSQGTCWRSKMYGMVPRPLTAWFAVHVRLPPSCAPVRTSTTPPERSSSS